MLPASRLSLISLLVLQWLHAGDLAVDATELKVTLKYQVPSATGRLAWAEHESMASWQANETCIILVDVWDKHWCPTATERLSALAMLMNNTLAAARKMGVLIVHAPSDCMAFYEDYPQRKWVLQLPNVTLPADKPHVEPTFPLDASDGGCDVPAQSYQAWHRENPLITIAEEDAISAGQDGRQTSQEIYNIMSARKIRNALYAGVHENMCIMTRPFGIKQLVKWDQFNVALIRELVDVMYNPLLSPYVSHAEGTHLMTGFIEKFWASTMSMYDFLNARSGSHSAGHRVESAQIVDTRSYQNPYRTSSTYEAKGNKESGKEDEVEANCGSPQLHYMCPWSR